MADLITMLSAAAGAGGINPREHFNTVLYTGTGSSLGVTGVGFQPDFVWLKSRSNGVRNHRLYDVIRGTTKELYSSTTDQESIDANGLTAFNSDGFTVGSSVGVNENTATMVGWNWKANGAGSSNTQGTITSTVSANTTAGISIVTWTNPSSNGNYTVGHGLGVAPKMIIAKQRSNAVQNWNVWHNSLPDNTNSVVFLDLTSAVTTISGIWGAGVFNGSTFSIKTAASGTRIFDNSATVVAYCFAEVEGFSKFGSYTGNGSATGPSVTTDFLPTWLMIKRSDTTGDWIILDSARDTANPRDKFLEANSADAEATGNDVDFNATGFQLKSTSASINASGGTYIYACFA